MCRSVLAGVLAVALHGADPTVAQSRSTPTRYVSGALPVAPPLVVAGGEVRLDVLVADDGHVDAIRTLRTTPPFTDAVIAAVRGWKFTPMASGRASDSRVLVAAMFTPPSLDGPTLGQPAQDIATPLDGTPVVTAAAPARYPPRAVGSGAVLVEVTIPGSGAPADARVVVSSPAFDAAAVAAAKSWSFAGASGGAPAVRAYLLFVFQQPVIGR